MAGTFDDAISAYKRGEYLVAIELLMPLAAPADANAQALLGIMYEAGRGVSQD